MSEIRPWAVGALAVVAIAVGTGAGVQIARTSDVPVAPVVAVAPEAASTTASTTVTTPAAPSTTKRPGTITRARSTAPAGG